MGIELGETRLINVDEYLETSIEGVFAAGDCVECVSAVTGKPTISQLGANAMRQGKVAGTNAAGGFMTYPKVLGACVTRLLETEIASTGLTETYANKFGIECVSASAKVAARPAFYTSILLSHSLDKCDNFITSKTTSKYPTSSLALKRKIAGPNELKRISESKY